MTLKIVDNLFIFLNSIPIKIRNFAARKNFL